MAKDETKVPETWGECMKEWGGGDFTFLSSDGEAITFIVVALPRQITTMYMKKPQERIACPVVTETGFQLFICGKRVARKIAKFEKQFATNAIMVVRHGAENDQNSKYTVKVLPEKETCSALLKVKSEDFKPEMIDIAIAAVVETLSK